MHPDIFFKIKHLCEVYFNKLESWIKRIIYIVFILSTYLFIFIYKTQNSEWGDFRKVFEPDYEIVQSYFVKTFIVN